jgi:quercetin dioxygenase-like cupin family protein
MAGVSQPPLKTPGGDLYWINGDFWRIVATSKDTEGRYALMDVTVSRNGGPKPHTHSREDESLYIIDGEFDVQYGSQNTRGTTGYHLLMRRGIAHSFKNVGDKSGRLMILFTPGGLEKMFEELGIPVSDVQTFTEPFGFPNFVKVLGILRKYGIDPKGPL